MVRERDNYSIDLSLKAAIYEGLYGRAGVLTPICSTGNCTWPVFTSLAICNQCQEFSFEYVDHKLPSGLWFNDTIPDLGYETMIVASGLLPVEDPEIKSPRLANISISGPGNGYECVLYWCIQEYNSSVRSGIFREDILTTWRQEPSSISVIAEHNPKKQNGEISHTTGYYFFGSHTATAEMFKNQTFSLSNDSHMSVVNYFKDFFTGNIIGDPSWGFNASSDAMQAFSHVEEISDNTVSVGLEDVPSLIGNLTKNLNVQMRQAADVNSSAIGTAWKTESYVLVRWQCLSFPIALLFLTLIFLVTTIMRNCQNKVPPWKSSTTALLLHGLSIEHQEKYLIHAHQNEMDAVAKKLKVQLQETEAGWQLK